VMDGASRSRALHGRSGGRPLRTLGLRSKGDDRIREGGAAFPAARAWSRIALVGTQCRCFARLPAPNFYSRMALRSHTRSLVPKLAMLDRSGREEGPPTRRSRDEPPGLAWHSRFSFPSIPFIMAQLWRSFHAPRVRRDHSRDVSPYPCYRRKIRAVVGSAQLSRDRRRGIRDAFEGFPLG
jgi:hypothetical protein